MPPILDRRVSVWRMANNPLGGQPGEPREKRQAIILAVHASIVPISSFTAEQAYARGSTHVLWVEPWLKLRMEDEIHYGHRDRDNYGDADQPEIYTVNGRRVFTGIGPRLRSYYVRVLE